MGISLPVIEELYAPLELPDTLELLEGDVAPRLDVDVSRFEAVESEAPPAPDWERTANSICPLCGSTRTSRMWPSVLPSCDCTVACMISLSRTFLPDCMELLLEPRVLELEPRVLELDDPRLPELDCDPRLPELDCDELDEEFGIVLEDDCWASRLLPVSDKMPPQIMLVTLRFFIFYTPLFWFVA